MHSKQHLKQLRFLISAEMKEMKCLATQYLHR